ncbi:rhodanese-related sulfurtransferase [Clostridium polynesiense]|uniref:oxygen-dependent tRNA uridine(34) hydroxylase TrhO n=1 Tax=Clostridium polynesiense TaxID=1325933 RepID=UPI000694859B|nr:rhodanese-related sulfurtransferase [Clostridium polynesiense]
MTEKPYRVLLYYKFVHIDNPEDFAAEHLKLCKDLGLKGRILVAEEGINGTVSGLRENTDKYIEVLHQDERFKDMIFKTDEAADHAFKKMYVRRRKSIITLKEDDDVNPNNLVGEYLKPKDFYNMLQQEDVIVVDGRNDYEYEIGHFRGAIRPDVNNFKEFPKWIEENLKEHKDKKILTYCTGGIRCEKLTGVLLNQGFKDVYHLEGGIVTYGKDPEVQGRLFDGKCYVFDERISVKVNNTKEDKIISVCSHCGKPSDRYINCTNDDCHDQHLCCEECEEKYEGFCSEECHKYVIKHPERDARIRRKAKLELYKKYNQNHEKADYFRKLV